jgi:hypothetical protein
MSDPLTFYTFNNSELNALYKGIVSGRAGKDLDAKKAGNCDKNGINGIEDGQEEQEFLSYLGSVPNNGTVTITDESGNPSKIYYLSASTEDGGPVRITTSEAAATLTTDGVTGSIGVDNIEDTTLKAIISSDVKIGPSGEVIRVPMTFITPLELEYNILSQKIEFSLFLEAAKSDPNLAKSQKIDGKIVALTDDELINAKLASVARVTVKEIDKVMGKVNPKEKSENVKKKREEIRGELAAKKLTEWKAGLIEKAKSENKYVFRSTALKLYDEIDQKAEELAELLNTDKGKLKEEEKKALEGKVRDLMDGVNALYGRIKKDDTNLESRDKACLLVKYAKTFFLFKDIFKFEDKWLENRLYEAAQLDNNPFTVAILADFYFQAGIKLGSEINLVESFKIFQHAIDFYKSKNDQQNLFVLVSLLSAQFKRCMIQLNTLGELKPIEGWPNHETYDESFRVLSEHLKTLGETIKDNIKGALDVEVKDEDLEAILATGRVEKLKLDTIFMVLSDLKVIVDGKDDKGNYIMDRQNKVLMPQNVTDSNSALDALRKEPKKAKNLAGFNNNLVMLGERANLTINMNRIFKAIEEQMRKNGQEVTLDGLVAFINNSRKANPKSEAVFNALIKEAKKAKSPDKLRKDLADQSASASAMIEHLNIMSNNLADFEIQRRSQNSGHEATLADIAAFINNRIDVYGKIINEFSTFNKGLTAEIRKAVNEVGNKAAKMLEAKIASAEADGNVDLLMSIGSSVNIGKYALTALQSAGRAAEKRGDTASLVKLGDIFLSRAGAPWLKTGEADLQAEQAYMKAMEFSKDSNDLKAIGYKLLKLGRLQLAEAAFRKAKSFGGNNVDVEAEMEVCKSTKKITSNPTGLEINDNILVPDAEIYGALKSIKTDLKELSSEEINGAVAAVYRRHGYRATCRVTNYDKEKGVLSIFIAEGNIARIVINGIGMPRKMADKYVLDYFPKVGELVNEEKIKESINNLKNCNQTAIKNADYKVIETPEGAVLEIDLSEVDSSASPVSVGGSWDERGNRGFTASTQAPSFLDRGKPFDLNFDISTRSNYVDGGKYVTWGFGTQIPANNRTSWIVAYGQGRDNTPGSKSITGGIRHQWSTSVTTQHTAGLRTNGGRKDVVTNNSANYSTEQWKANSVTPVDGSNIYVGTELGSPIGHLGTQHYKAEITGTRHFPVLSQPLDDRMVFSVSGGVGTGENLDRYSQFRAGYRERLGGREYVNGRAELGYTVPWISEALPTQVFVYGGADTAAGNMDDLFRQGNRDMSTGVGIRINLPIPMPKLLGGGKLPIGFTITVDSKHGVGFDLGNGR